MMGKHSILIVDDEPRLLKSLSLLLRDSFDVVTASNGKEGYELFKTNPYLSMILLDLDMPVMNGIEMLERVRGENNKMKVVVMTGRSSHEWARQCADMNVQGYLEKPFDIDELTGKIRKILKIKECDILRSIFGKEYDERMTSISNVTKRALEYIYSTDPSEFNIKQIAAHLNVTQEHLSRTFHKETGIQLKEYVGRVRAEKSKKNMAENPGAKLQEIANSVGINDVSYFCQLFKKYTGLTPAEYRKNLVN